MTGFIKVSNSIFDYKLSPAAMFLYCAMLSKANVFKSLCSTYAQLSQLCNMDGKTIRKAIAELETHSLITKSNRYNARGYLANRYTLKQLPKGGWFKLPREVFTTTISKTAFVVYCFIIKFMNSKNENAFPSLNAISDKKTGTGLSKTTVCKAIDYLRSHTFLNRIHRHYKKTHAYRNNHYLRFCCKTNNVRKNKKKKGRLSQHPILKNFANSFNSFSISKLWLKVKRFFKNILVVHNFLNSS